MFHLVGGNTHQECLLGGTNVLAQEYIGVLECITVSTHFVPKLLSASRAKALQRCCIEIVTTNIMEMVIYLSITLNWLSCRFVCLVELLTFGLAAAIDS